MRTITRVICSLSILILIGWSAIASAQTATERERSKPRSWEHESSDIPIHPELRFGHLPNGLRYVWKANPEPDRRSYLRLHVDAGSLAETDPERGMAHFLEHMAFNGSDNFPAGTLIEWFQKHGMGFGADTNAFTSFSETVYMIDLPTSDETSMREGFQVLRDFAGGLLLEKKEIDAEKGVIDGEERERDSAGARTFEEWFTRMYDGTLYAQRLPIGIKEARDAFDPKSVRAFYQRWYRPENMTIVVVGDFESRDPSALIKELFADLEPPKSAPVSEPAIGKATLENRFFFVSEEELPMINISVSKLRPYVEEAATIANWRKDLPLVYARAILNLRFYELAKEEGAPFVSASLDSSTQFDVFEGELLSITCAPENWEKALGVCEQELRRALRHGFQDAELAELRADALRGLDESVQREATRSSGSYVSSLLAAAESRFVPTDAKTRRDIQKPVLEKLTAEACHKALVASWTDGKLMITGSGNLDLGEKAGETMRAAWVASRRTEVTAGEKIESSEWAYGSANWAGKAPDPAKVATREVEDLGIELVELANGVRLNLKQTDFKKNQILIAGRLGEGRLSLPKDRQAVGMVADSVFDQGGLGAHDADTIRRLTAGKLVGFGFGTGEDHFAFGGSTTSEDLLMQFEMICAYLNDPGWREDGLIQLRRVLPQLFEALDHQAQGPLMRKFIPDLYSNDPRYVYPTQEQLTAVGMKDVREWLNPHLATAPIEITLVGDFDPQQVKQYAAKSLALLPPRREPKRWEENRKVPAIRTGLRSTYTIDTEVPKSLVMVLFPTTDGIETARRRTLGFLAQVVNDRLRLDVREKLGLAYSPNAVAQSSTVSPGDGKLTIQVLADPDETDKVIEACFDVARSLSKDGVSDEELGRLREPLIARIRDSFRQNGYWISAISEAQSDPGSLDDARSVLAFYEKLEAKPLSELAKKYLVPEKASVLVVNPRLEEKAEATEGNGDGK